MIKSDLDWVLDFEKIVGNLSHDNDFTNLVREIQIDSFREGRDFGRKETMEYVKKFCHEQTERLTSF